MNTLRIQTLTLLTFLVSIDLFQAAPTQKTAPVCMGTAGVYYCEQMTDSLSNPKYNSSYLPLQPSCRKAVEALELNVSRGKPCSLIADAMRQSTSPDYGLCELTNPGQPSCSDLVDKYLWSNGDCMWMFNCFFYFKWNIPAWISHYCTSHSDMVVSSSNVGPVVGWTIHDSSGKNNAICTHKAPRYCSIAGATGKGWQVYWQMCNPMSITNIGNMRYNISKPYFKDNPTMSKIADINSVSISIPMSGSVPNFTHPKLYYSLANFWVGLACLQSSSTPVVLQMDFHFDWEEFDSKTNQTQSYYDIVTVELTKTCEGVQTTTPKDLSAAPGEAVGVNSIISLFFPNGSIENQTIHNFYASALNWTDVPEVRFHLGNMYPLSPTGVYLSPSTAKFNKSVQILFQTLPSQAKYDANFVVVSGKSLHGTDWIISPVSKTSRAYTYMFYVNDFSRPVYFIAKLPAPKTSALAPILLNDWQLIMVILAAVIVCGLMGLFMRSRQYDVRKTEYNAISVAEKLHSAKA